MPDTFGKRQREADKAKRREAKDARRVARKAGELSDPTPAPPDVPHDDPGVDDSAEEVGAAEAGHERGETADGHA
jgi:hypothetical protein